MKEAVLELKSKSRKELIEMGDNGYRFVKKNHSIENLTKKLIKIIEDV